jgi:hypothetical protein
MNGRETFHQQLKISVEFIGNAGCGGRIGSRRFVSSPGELAKYRQATLINPMSVAADHINCMNVLAREVLG